MMTLRAAVTTFAVAAAMATTAAGLAYSQSSTPDSPAREKARTSTSQTQPEKRASAAKTSATKTSTKANKLAIQVDENKPEVMNLALNNARNVIEHFKTQGESVSIEIVAFGPGLHMLREDTSPVKQRIAEMSLAEPGITFVACANTQQNQSKQEQKPITLISEAKLYPSGVIRLMELQSQGYAYIRP